MAETKPAAKKTAARPVPEVYRNFAQLVQQVPAGDDGTAMVGILESLVQATTYDALNAPWDVNDTEKVLDRLIIVTGIKRQASAYADGLGVFLVVSATDTETGELLTFTTGAVSVVAQLVRAYTANLFPAKGFLRQSATPSANGYYPQHFQFTGTPQAF